MQKCVTKQKKQPQNKSYQNYHMKKSIILALVFSAWQLVAFAQEESRIAFGIFGGANIQNINGTNDAGVLLKNTLVPKFVFGLNLSYMIAPEFYLQPGLQYIGKGTKGTMPFVDNNGSHSITRELSLNYIEMPINFIYKPLLGSGHLLLGFGPYIGYCIGGKAVFSGSPEVAEEKLVIGKTVPNNQTNNLSYFKPLDVGANFLVGYEFQNGLQFILNSQLGLINVNSDNASSLTNKNTGFGLLVGYQF